MREVHAAWAWVTVLSNAAVGGWALAAHRWPALRTRALWPATVAAQVTVFVQVLLGVLTMNSQDVEPSQVEFHMFYGFVALISIAILFAYREQLRDRLYLLYGLGGLWVMGLGIRAMVLHR